MLRVSKTMLIACVVVAAVLLGLRIAAPYLLRDYVNRNLHRLDDYDGHVDGVDIALWRGAYALKNVVIVKKIPPTKRRFAVLRI